MRFYRLLVLASVVIVLAGPSSAQLRFPDATEQTTAGVTYAQTVVVSPDPAGATASGTALIAALAAITDAASDKPYLLKVEPGTFDLGSSSLPMKTYVDLEGSGQRATVIKSTNGTGTVIGADFVALRALTIANTGGGTNAVALLCDGVVLVSLKDVTLSATGGSTFNVGLEVDASGFVELWRCTVFANGGTTAYGIWPKDGSQIDLKCCKVSATGGSLESYGGFVDCSIVKARQCEIHGTDNTFAVFTSGVGCTGHVFVTGSQLSSHPRFWITDINEPNISDYAFCYTSNFADIDTLR